MAANPWFRLYAEFAHDPKVQMMSEAMQRRYIMLLCMRCSNVTETLHVTEIAFYMRISNEELAETKSLFISKGFIDDDWNVLNWEKRQFASDSSAARVSKYREKKKQESNGYVTLPKRKCNALDTDTDTDISKPSVESKKITFDGSNFQNINGHMAVWKKAYPAVDIEIELQKAAAWLVSNPNNRKSQYGRYLNGWLTRAQDRAPRVGSSSTSSSLFDGVVGYEQN